MNDGRETTTKEKERYSYVLWNSIYHFSMPNQQINVLRYLTFFVSFFHRLFLAKRSKMSKALEELKAAVDRPTLMDKVGDHLVDDFREQMSQKAGKTGFRGLALALRAIDSNGAKKLTMTELSDCLKAYGINYRDANLERLFMGLDRYKSGVVSVNEFLHCVRPAMPMGRRDLVMQAYTLLESNGAAIVKLGDIFKCYDTSEHPEVIVGKMTPDQVISYFMSGWDTNGDRPVGKDEFVEYYTDISAGISSDLYFELMIRNGWHVSGGNGLSQNTTCLRVLVKFQDGRQAISEVKNDLRVSRTDMSSIREHLEKQGVHHIREITLV
jgi:hypothetical protein